ncbi:MAG: histidine kinase [Bacteroidales bacterium]
MPYSAPYLAATKFIWKFLVTSMIVRVNRVLIYFLLISIDYLVLSFEEMQERAEHETALSAMLRDAELAMLRSQIRPHFLFNSLNSVSALTLTNPAAAQDMIIKSGVCGTLSTWVPKP